MYHITSEKFAVLNRIEINFNWKKAILYFYKSFTYQKIYQFTAGRFQTCLLQN